MEIAADQRTATQILADTMNAPGWGVEVTHVVPISLERAVGAAIIDGPVNSGQGSTVLEGRNLRGLVFVKMFVS